MKNNTTSNLSLASLMPQLATGTPNQLCRYGVFETNSSSCHSLSLQLNQDGELETNPTLFSDFHIGEDGKLFLALTNMVGKSLNYIHSMTNCLM